MNAKSEMRYINKIAYLIIIFLLISCKSENNNTAQNDRNNEIADVSKKIQNILKNKSSGYMVLEPADTIINTQEIKLFLKKYDIITIYLWRYEKTKNDSVIIYSTGYNPLIEKRKSIEYNYQNGKVLFRKHKNQSY